MLLLIMMTKNKKEKEVVSVVANSKGTSFMFF